MDSDAALVTYVGEMKLDETNDGDDETTVRTPEDATGEDEKSNILTNKEKQTWRGAVIEDKSLWFKYKFGKGENAPETRYTE